MNNGKTSLEYYLQVKQRLSERKDKNENNLTDFLKETIMKDISKIVREYKLTNRDFDVRYRDLFQEASESYQALKSSSKEKADDFVRQMIEIRYNKMK